MKTTFSIHYNTTWGESLCLVLNDKKYPMTWSGDGLWTVCVNASAAALKDYWYIVTKDGLTIRSEWEHHSAKSAAEISDSWNDCPMRRTTRAE